MSADAEIQTYNTPSPLFGHREIMDRIFNGHQQNRLHHGWLLAGDEGIGKFRLAQQIAAWILSIKDTAAQPLFEDGEGHPHPADIEVESEEARLVFGNTHPDLLLLQPEQDDKNKSGLIKTEQLRKLPAFFAHHAARSKWRVAIIDSLDVVNRAGMNAMLKTLEEPPANCLLLLLSSRPGQILPTIRSRCITANLSPLTSTDTAGVLATIWPDADKEALGLLAGLSKGAPGRALQLADAGVLDMFEASCSLLSDNRAKPADLIALAEKWSAGGARGRPVRQAASYLFPELLLLATLYQMESDAAHQNSLAQIGFIEQAARVLAIHHTPEQLANLHREFGASYQLNERLYLDFAPIMTKFFFDLTRDLRSQSANR